MKLLSLSFQLNFDPLMNGTKKVVDPLEIFSLRSKLMNHLETYRLKDMKEILKVDKVFFSLLLLVLRQLKLTPKNYNWQHLRASVQCVCTKNVHPAVQMHKNMGCSKVKPSYSSWVVPYSWPVYILLELHQTVQLQEYFSTAHYDLAVAVAACDHD